MTIEQTAANTVIRVLSALLIPDVIMRRAASGGITMIPQTPLGRSSLDRLQEADHDYTLGRNPPSLLELPAGSIACEFEDCEDIVNQLIAYGSTCMAERD